MSWLSFLGMINFITKIDFTCFISQCCICLEVHFPPTQHLCYFFLDDSRLYELIGQHISKIHPLVFPRLHFKNEYLKTLENLAYFLLHHAKWNIFHISFACNIPLNPSVNG